VRSDPIGAATLGLRYGTIQIRVESDDVSHLEWLREFLTPAFDVVETLRPDWTVRLVTDPVGYADVLRRGPDPGGRDVPCFSLDSGTVRLPLWTTLGAGWFVLDGQSGAFLLLGARGVVQILTSGERPAVRNALMRVVRELAMAGARQRGGLVLHAAGVAAGERVILIAGPKGGGKTTLLVHLLRAPGTRFVANDRAVVSIDGSAPAARGLPTIVKLLHESAEWFPGLLSRLRRSAYHHRLTMAEAHRREPRRGTAPSKALWSVSPAQFCSLVDTIPVAGGPLGGVVFPCLTGRSGSIAWRRLSSAEAAAAMAGAQLGSLHGVPPEGGVPAWMLEAEHPATPTPTRAPGTDWDRCRALAARVPVFEIALGHDAYADASSASRLLEAVGG
jgi:hypothetical protein